MATIADQVVAALPLRPADDRPADGWGSAWARDCAQHIRAAGGRRHPLGGYLFEDGSGIVVGETGRWEARTAEQLAEQLAAREAEPLQVELIWNRLGYRLGYVRAAFRQDHPGASRGIPVLIPEDPAALGGVLGPGDLPPGLQIAAPEGEYWRLLRIFERQPWAQAAGRVRLAEAWDACVEAAVSAEAWLAYRVAQTSGADAETLAALRRALGAAYQRRREALRGVVRPRPGHPGQGRTS